MNIPPECLKKVILGERVGEDVAMGFFRLIEDTSIVGDRAVANHWDYNLELMPFKIGPYKSGGKEISSFVFRNYRHYPSL